MRTFSVFLVLFGLLTVSVASAQGPVLRRDEVLGFADHLFEMKDYYRAITEYERFLYLFPRDAAARHARYQIARCYFEGDKLSAAIGLLRTLIAESAEDDAGRDALFLLGQTYYLRRDYDLARETYEDFLRYAPTDGRADVARIRIGLSSLRQGNWQEAGELFDGISVDSPLRPEAKDLAAASRAYPDLPVKSPALAGWLSAIVPGAGQLYVGRPRDATVSFLLNGAFIWATTEQFRHNRPVTGGILLFFETGWYLGNIYNAVGSAHKYNRDARRSYFDGLERRTHLSYYPTGGGTGILSLNVQF